MPKVSGNEVDGNTPTTDRPEVGGRSQPLVWGVVVVSVAILLGLAALVWVRVGDDDSEVTRDRSLLELGPQYVAAVIGVERVPNGTGEFLTDGIRARAWTSPWTQDTSFEPCADRKAEAPGVEVDIRDPLTSQPRPLREFAIDPGLSVNDPNRAQEWQPKTLELWWTIDKKTSCTEIQLPNAPGQVRFPAPAGGVQYVTIRVAEVHPAPQGAPANQVSIGEVTFWKR